MTASVSTGPAAGATAPGTHRRDRFAQWLAGLWGGVLLCVAGLATPVAFAVLDRSAAGLYAARVLGLEARLAVLMSVVLFVLERGRARRRAASGHASVFSTEMVLLLGALFCTVAGYFAIQPLMAAARAGQGALSFGALHGISSAFYAVKVVLVLVVAWRLARR